MRRPDHLIDSAARSLSTRLASGMTRRSFLGRMGGAVLAATGGAAVAAAVEPEQSEAFHLCGHIWTTGPCPQPAPAPPLRRPLLDAGLLAEPARAPADRQERLSAPPERRPPDRQPWSRDRFGRLGCRRRGQAAARARRRSAPPGAADAALRGMDARALRPRLPHAG